MFKTERDAAGRAAGDARPGRPELERRPPGKLHRYAPASPAGDRPSRSRRGSVCHSRRACAWWWPTGGHARPVRRRHSPPRSRRRRCAGGRAAQNRSPSCAGWKPATSPFSACANTGLPASSRRGDLGRRPKPRPRRAARPGVHVLRRGPELVAMTPEIRRFFFAPAPLIITKANVISRVHRRVHMDYVGIKTYRSDGTPDGEMPHRRPVHLAGLRQLAARHPVPAPQGRRRCSSARAIRRRATTARRCSTCWRPSRATSCSRSTPSSSSDWSERHP